MTDLVKDVAKDLVKEFQQKKKYKHDVLAMLNNPDHVLNESLQLFDSLDFHLVGLWDSYLKGVESLLIKVVMEREEDAAKKIFKEAFLSGDDTFNHYFKIDDKQAGLLRQLDNQEGVSTVLYHLNTNYVEELATSFKKYQQATGELPDEHILKTLLSTYSTKDGGTALKNKRALLDDYAHIPLESLGQRVYADKSKLRILSFMNLFQQKAVSKLNSINYAGELAKDVKTFGRSLDLLASRFSKTDESEKFDSVALSEENKAMFIGNYLVDDLMGGLERGNVHLICSQQGNGKTQELILLALDAIVKSNKKVVFVSPEVPEYQVWSRVISYFMNRYNFEHYNRGVYSKETIDKLIRLTGISNVLRKVRDNLIVLDASTLPMKEANVSYKSEDTSLYDFDGLCQKVKAYHKDHNFDLLFIDSYYKLADDLNQAALTSKLEQRVARELSIPIICSTQLNTKNTNINFTDEKVRSIDNNYLKGGANVANPVSWIYAVFTVHTNKENCELDSRTTPIYQKKYIVMKRRHSKVKETCFMGKCDFRERDFTVYECSEAPMTYQQQQTLRGLFEYDLELAGLKTIYSGLNKSFEKDSNKFIELSTGQVSTIEIQKIEKETYQQLFKAFGLNALIEASDELQEAICKAQPKDKEALEANYQTLLEVVQECLAEQQDENEQVVPPIVQQPSEPIHEKVEATHTTKKELDEILSTQVAELNNPMESLETPEWLALQYKELGLDILAAPSYTKYELQFYLDNDRFPTEKEFQIFVDNYYSAKSLEESKDESGYINQDNCFVPNWQPIKLIPYEMPNLYEPFVKKYHNRVRDAIREIHQGLLIKQEDPLARDYSRSLEEIMSQAKYQNASVGQIDAVYAQQATEVNKIQNKRLESRVDVPFEVPEDVKQAIIDDNNISQEDYEKVW